MASTVLSAADQAALTPLDVLNSLRAGNARFAAGMSTERDHVAQLPAAVEGQHPMAIVLSCVDSRVPVEIVFDCGIGDLFVARVAGNCANPDILGSIEYACKVAGSKLVVVLGHQHCGAVKSAIDGVELGNITALLSKITPSVEAAARAADAAGADDDRTSANAAFVAQVTETNVHNTIGRVRAESPTLADMESDGEISIVGAVYSLESGEVSFLDEAAS